jgi:hypothetical protein
MTDGFRQVLVAHTCNPSYSEIRRIAVGSQPQANSWRYPIIKKGQEEWQLHESCHKQFSNKWVWFCSNKTLFAKSNGYGCVPIEIYLQKQVQGWV